MTLKIIFLDDDEQRAQKAQEQLSKLLSNNVIFNIVWTKTAQDTILVIQDELYGASVLSLDHDLGNEVFVDSDRPDCGYEVVRWLIENPQPQIKLIFVHSWNIPAAKRMTEDLGEAGYYTIMKPFGM